MHSLRTKATVKVRKRLLNYFHRHPLNPDSKDKKQKTTFVTYTEHCMSDWVSLRFCEVFEIKILQVQNNVTIED